METYHTIPTTDNHLIYGTLNSVNSNQLIIFVHGFTGNQNEHQYFNAVPYFNSQKFDTFRFDFYSDADQARSLGKISLADHIHDLSRVISRWQSQYEKIIVIGHSLAGLIVPQTNLQNVDQIVLWDPTSNFKNVAEKGGHYEPTIDSYIFSRGIDFIVSNSLVEQWRATTISSLIKKIHIPTAIVFAEHGGKHNLWIPEISAANVPIPYRIITHASHCFTESGTEKALFETTLEFLSS